ncbi:hypothetical protein A2U01_0066914, partial [Trifolium medium]|nr:hypothetical protein [Trifolium medium]
KASQTGLCSRHNCLTNQLRWRQNRKANKSRQSEHRSSQIEPTKSRNDFESHFAAKRPPRNGEPATTSPEKDPTAVAESDEAEMA